MSIEVVTPNGVKKVRGVEVFGSGGGVDGYIKSGLVYQDNNLSNQADGLMEISPGITFSQNEITAEICFRADAMGYTYTRVFETAGLTFGLSKASGDVAQNSDYTVNPFFTVEAASEEIKEPIDNLCFGDVHTLTVKRNLGFATAYLDGVMLGTFSSKTTSFSATSIYFMHGEVGGRVTQGTWFNARIYNRLLSDAEIATNYAEDVRLYGR